jgi:signal transduction histidine kinase
MTIRWKINTAFLMLLAVFLAAAAVTIHAVRVTAEQTRSYLRMRELAQYTADVRALVYAQCAAAVDSRSLPADVVDEDWAAPVLQDIDVNVRLALTDEERALWQGVRDDIVAFTDAREGHAAAPRVAVVLQRLEQGLRDLRHYYDITQYDSIATISSSSFHAQVAIGAACALTVLLFLTYMMMIRRWLIRPIDVLKASAVAIGRGDLAHRVPLGGRDELSELARGIDAMATGLAAHQAELVRAREFSAIGEMCANVAHGLRNPLAAIRSSAQLGARRANGSPGAAASFNDLAHQADLMDQRITRLFKFSRPLQLLPTATRFAELAGAARAQAEPITSAREVGVIIDDQLDGRAWRIDGERIAEALAELIMNAAHHSPKGAAVTVRGRMVEAADADALCIEVIDHGAGMSAATQAKACDPFFTTRAGGTGMGLALVRRLIEQHGGSLDLTSQPGHGTSVRITLRDLACDVRETHPTGTVA